MSITLVPGPEFEMRYNQNLYPVPDEFKTSGQYYKNLGEDLKQDFEDCCCESGTQAAKAEKRLDNFHNTLSNIKHFAARVIQKHYLRYKRKYKMRTGNYFKALRHNGVNYSSVLHLLLKQRWENYLKDETDSILNYTIERVTEKINRQRAVVLIQRNFRRWKAEINYNTDRWSNYNTDRWLKNIIEQARKRNEEEEEEEDLFERGYEEMEAYRIEMEAERDARLAEDMDRMREMYFD